MLYVACGLLVVLLLANLAATRAALGGQYTQPQRVAQLAVVWLLPGLGAVAILAVARLAHEEPEREHQESSWDD